MDFKKNGFTYKLHKKQENVSLYEQWDLDNPSNPILVSYEIITNSKTWTYSALKRANEKFEEILNFSPEVV